MPRLGSRPDVSESGARAEVRSFIPMQQRVATLEDRADVADARHGEVIAYLARIEAEQKRQAGRRARVRRVLTAAGAVAGGLMALAEAINVLAKALGK